MVGGAGVFLSARAKLRDQLLIIRRIVAVHPRIARRVDARGAVQCLHREPRVICKRRKPRLVTVVPRLDARIFHECRAILDRLFDRAELRLQRIETRQRDKAHGQPAKRRLHLPHLPRIGRGDQYRLFLHIIPPVPAAMRAHRQERPSAGRSVCECPAHRDPAEYSAPSVQRRVPRLSPAPRQRHLPPS